jgi:GntR family transcriptional regulator
MTDVYRLASAPQRAPLATQATTSIRRAILDGHWGIGQRLPSEPQLATELGISRATLREALRMLVSDGLLDRRHGVGTFVSRLPAPTIERGIDELFSLGEAIEQLGYEASVGNRAVEVGAPSRSVAEELRLAPDEAVCHMSRVRMADGRPVILCEDHFPARLLVDAHLDADEAAAQVVEIGSLYSWFEERLGIAIDWALTHIEPVAASATSAATLGVPAGTALIRLRQTHHAVDGTPVLYSENVHNSDVIRFHVQRRRALPGLAAT